MLPQNTNYHALLLITIAVLMSACGVITETAGKAAETSVEKVEETIDPPIADEDPITDGPLDDIIEEAEEDLEQDQAIENQEELLLPAPVVTFRELDGATPESIEHIAYVEAFWTESAGDLGFDYEPLDNGRLLPRSIIGVEEEQVCSFRRIEQPVDPDIAAFNAYVTPCDEGITVVWDDIGLEPDLEQRFPGAGMAMLISHEWGHVVQLQRDQLNQSDLIAEQQADCYSGAYAAWAEDRGIEPFTSPESLDFAIISTLETRDAVGSRPDDFGAHGNGFDRVRATQEGYDRGVNFCASYDETPPPITQSGFTTAADRQNEGNLPFEPAFELLVPAVIDYYESLSSEPLAAFVDEPDERLLRDLHAEIGDVAIGTEYSLRYGAAVQEANGDEVGGIGPALQRACLAGAFLQDALTNGIGDDGTNTGTAAGTLSPGDLDEAIITLTSSDELLSNPGLVFEMVAALRVGTLEGLDACALA